jgi:enoyl-CoA hydratase/carnithine racemase
VGDLRIELDGPVAVLTLDRPEQLNTFTGAMGAELEAAYRRCDEDDAIRAVVLTGAGRAFCAGADFSGGSEVFAAPEAGGDGFRSDPFAFHAWDVRKPVIAAVNGHAVGLGLTLALQCDLRYVAAAAKLGIVQNRRGILPDLRSHWTLPRLVGHGRAAELLLTGRMFSGTEAAEWGVALEALADGPTVLERALEVAHDVAVNVAPRSVAASKAILWRSPAADAAEVDAWERAVHVALMGSPDTTEGVMAWVEKRDPQWRGTLADGWPRDLHPGAARD